MKPKITAQDFEKNILAIARGEATYIGNDGPDTFTLKPGQVFAEDSEAIAANIEKIIAGTVEVVAMPQKPTLLPEYRPQTFLEALEYSVLNGRWR